MQFLNPLVLIALAAASVPLLLHLLQRRKLKPIPFSTLRFLKELQKTTVRRFKLRQLLLLILRTLIITFVVLAFARPALRGTIGGFGAHAHSTVVILLDNSLSMDARDANGQIFESARTTVSQIAGLLEEGDNAALVRLAEVDDKSTQQLTHDFAQFKHTLAATTVVPGVARIHDGLRIASSILSSSQNPNKEVYLVTDAQRVSFPGLPAALPLFDPATHVIVVREGTRGRRTEDLSVDSLRLLTAVYEPGKPIDVEAIIRNSGGDEVAAAMVRLLINGRTVAQRSVRVAPHGMATVTMSAPLDATGVIALAATVDDEAIERDNARVAALFVPAAFRVALVAETPDAARFIRAALEPDPASHGYFAITDVPATHVGGLNFESYDAIVFAALPKFSANDAKRFHAYLENGGGALIFGGGDVATYNAIAREAGLPPAERQTAATGTPFLFGNVSLDHPIFAGVFERGLRTSPNGVAESPRVQSMARFSEEGAGEAVIRMANGTPFLLRTSVGRGRAILCAASPTLDGSDFPMKPIFVPVVTRGVLYAGTLDAVGMSLGAGEPMDLPLRRGDATGVVTVRGPDNAVTKISPRVLPTSAVLPLDGMRTCGVYGLYSAQGAPIGAFAVNPDRRESDLATLSDAELTQSIDSLAGMKGAAKLVEPGAAMTGSIMQIRFGVELWRACIYAALLCALLEMVVARTMKNEVIEETAGSI